MANKEEPTLLEMPVHPRLCKLIDFASTEIPTLVQSVVQP